MPQLAKKETMVDVAEVAAVVVEVVVAASEVVVEAAALVVVAEVVVSAVVEEVVDLEAEEVVVVEAVEVVSTVLKPQTAVALVSSLVRRPPSKSSIEHNTSGVFLRC
jgi:hypothetical protein